MSHCDLIRQSAGDDFLSRDNAFLRHDRHQRGRLGHCSRIDDAERQCRIDKTVERHMARPDIRRGAGAAWGCLGHPEGDPQAAAAIATDGEGDARVLINETKTNAFG